MFYVQKFTNKTTLNVLKIKKILLTKLILNEIFYFAPLDFKERMIENKHNF